jgi:hypothetical protein
MQVALLFTFALSSTTVAAAAAVVAEVGQCSVVVDDTAGAPAAFQNSGGSRPTGLPFASRSPVMAQHGMAATSQPLSTQVALDILKAGGSAVDAAM